MRRRPYGPAAWLVDDVGDPARWADAVRRSSTPGVVEVVPAETTVVVRCDRRLAVDVGRALDLVVAHESTTVHREPIVIAVDYDGEDLAEVAELADMSVDDVIALHTGGEYRVAFCGFSPGFAYLTGLDQRLRLPRRQRPRTTVPAGSVALAVGYTAVYPSPSPGGWHLIGRTAHVVWDADRDPPALLPPGTPVRFRETG